MHQGLDQIMINKMLNRQDITSEELVPLLLIAQNNNQDVIIQNMVGYVQRKPEMVNKLMMLTRTMYDNNGDNLAVTIAFVELFSKIVLYWLHERIWLRINL